MLSCAVCVDGAQPQSGQTAKGGGFLHCRNRACCWYVIECWQACGCGLTVKLSLRPKFGRLGQQHCMATPRGLLVLQDSLAWSWLGIYLPWPAGPTGGIFCWFARVWAQVGLQASGTLGRQVLPQTVWCCLVFDGLQQPGDKVEYSSFEASAALTESGPCLHPR